MGSGVSCHTEATCATLRLIVNGHRTAFTLSPCILLRCVYNRGVNRDQSHETPRLPHWLQHHRNHRCLRLSSTVLRSSEHHLRAQRCHLSSQRYLLQVIMINIDVTNAELRDMYLNGSRDQDELTKPNISDYLDRYHQQWDEVWQNTEKAICALEELNETIEDGDLEVAPRDVNIIKAKLQELESKFSVFREAGYRTPSMTGFPSIRK